MTPDEFPSDVDIRTAVFAQAEVRGITQAQLAELAGCSPKHISVWRSGRGQISIDMAQRLMAALGISLRVDRRRR